MKTALFAGVLCITTAISAAASVQSFDQRENVQAWQFHNGPEFPGATGEISWDANQGHAAPGCLALEYSFVGGGNYVQASGPVPASVDARLARIWLNKPGAHRITFRVVDSAGQTFQKGVDYESVGWQQVEVDLTHWQMSYGGPGDNHLRPPLKQFGVLIENTASPKQGTLLIDDLEFLPNAPSESTAVTYTALDFSGISGGLHGGPGNSLEKGKWTYNFNGGDASGWWRDFSLYGEPVTMRIHLQSDGSGHGVRVQLGSHFQSFQKQVGTLSATPGEQIIEAPLGKLVGWEHFGGSNDGVARMPLRFREIALVPREGGPKTGSIQIDKIEIVSLPRDGQLVVLVPDVRQEAGQVSFSVKAINLHTRSVKGKLTCDVRGLGNSLAQHQTEITLGSDGTTAEWSVQHPFGKQDAQLPGSEGTGFIEAVFQWSDDQFTSKPVSIGACPVPTDPGSSELHPESLVGAGLYLYRYQHTPNYREPIARVCDLAQRASVKWTREEIQWHATEPAEGQFEWKFYDDVVDIAHDHGISVYGLLCYWSGWAAKDTPQGVDQYCRWVRQVVRHYKGKIKHWEIWNEPNIFFWSGPRELYAEMLTKAYAAIKEEDPDAVVMGCSTAGIDTEFIKKVMSWGGKFDALTIHPYRGIMNDLGFIKELQDVRKLVDGREVWLTEIGFPSQLIDGWSERNQASLCARVYLCTAASGAGRSVSWYDFRNDSNDPFYNEMNFGLVRNDLRPKPGYGTLATFGRTVGAMQLKGPVTVCPDAYGFRFSDGKQDVIAVCSPDKGQLLSYRATDKLEVINAFGESVQPARGDESSIIPLDAGFPTYIRGPAGFAFEARPAPITYSIEPTAARAGQTLKLQLQTQSEQWKIVRWDLPQGWPQPKPSGKNTWEILVPERAPAYQFNIQAVLDLNGGKLHLPLRVSVSPSVIRL